MRIYFYPRPPRGGRRTSGYSSRCAQIFLSTPSARRATADYTKLSPAALKFLSTPSARRATRTRRWDSITQNYFYPRPPRGGRRQKSLLHHSPLGISIHALREEGDRGPLSPLRRPKYFYPRPPRGGRLGDLLAVFYLRYFYPRPPRGGRQLVLQAIVVSS